MKEINGVAFDIEGTVINLENGHHEAHLETARTMGIEITLEEAIQKLPHFIGGPDSAVAADILALLPCNNHNITPGEIVSLKNNLFGEYLRTAEILPRPGFVEFLDELRLNRTPTALGSATTREQAMLYIERSGLEPYFEGMMVLGEDIVNQKPEPDVYLATARLMGISTSRQLVFEDSPRGVRAGVAAQSTVIGMPVYYDNSNARRDLSQAGAACIFRDWGYVSIGSLQRFGIDVRGNARK